jgi:hypothetical protein
MIRQRGMALPVTIGVVSLIAILAVATLSLSSRMQQGSSLSLRDARLDAGAASGLASAITDWRLRRIGSLAVGSSREFGVIVPGVPVAVNVTVTRVSQDVFWIVSEASAEAGVSRRENLLARLRVPDGREVIAQDSTDVGMLGFIVLDSIGAHADIKLPSGAALTSPTGVVHVAGDATLGGGSGSGILIVEGRLLMVGPVVFSGVIVARGGISIPAPNVTLSGLLRAAGDPPVAGAMTYTKSEVVVQDVLTEGLRPRLVLGRRWAELY